MVKDYFINYLLFKNLSLENLSDVRVILEPLIAEKAAELIKKKDLQQLHKVLEKAERCIKAKDAMGSKKAFQEFHRIIGAVTENPILIFVDDFVESLLIDVENMLGAGNKLLGRGFEVHKHIYEALMKGDKKRARRETERHVKEIQSSLSIVMKGKVPL